MDDIYRETCVADYTAIRYTHLLAKRSVTKEKLASWLETVCCILDQHTMPWLEKAAPLTEELGKLKDEKISETIISLQNNVIKKQEDSLRSVQTTVETGMKSYASVVSKSCSNEFTLKRIQTVARKVAA